tara:strand:+ start:20463 stop:20990 length:528 start_codon:yes stop_codon:yes gene_type:complete
MLNKVTAVESTVGLLISVRGNCTTLEVKKYLRTAYSMKIKQQEVSDIMAQMTGLDFTDNGKYRTYVMANVQPILSQSKKVKKDKKKISSDKKKVSKSKMVEMMKNTKGRFITVTFRKKNGDSRTMNCQVDNSHFMNAQGYINVSENKGKKGRVYRQVNPRTIMGLKIDNQHFIRK